MKGALRLLAAAALGFLLGWLLRPEGGAGAGTAPAAPPGRAAAPLPVPGPVSPPPTVSPQDTLAAAPAATGPDAPSPGAARAWFEVEVRHADGTPASGMAYVLPAGGTGADDSERVPSAETDASGKARIPVADGGLFDVGFRAWSGSSAMARDLALERGQVRPVPLSLAPEKPIRFVVEPWPPDLQGEPFLRIGVDPEVPGGVASRSFPGRGEWVQGHHEAGIDSEGRGATPPLPPEIPFRFHADLQEMRPGTRDPAQPEIRATPFLPDPPGGVARAGDTVRLTLRRRGTIRLRVRTEPVLEPWTRLLFWLDLRQRGEVVSSIQYAALLEPGDGGPSLEVSLEGPEGPARLEWRDASDFIEGQRGIAVAAGAVESAFRSGAAEPAEVTFRVDPSTATPPRDEDPFPVTFEGVPAGREEEVSFAFYLLPGAGEEDGDFRPGGDLTEEATLIASDRGRRLQAFAGPDLVGEVQTVPASGPTRVRFRPGGLLQVAPEFLADRTLGNLAIRRADGLPLPRGRFEDGRYSMDHVRAEIVVEPGAILGPLPTGTVTFEVRLGGVRLPDATAAVRAGGIEVLRIRRAPE